MITQRYNLNLIPDKVPVIVNCSQYDALSRTIEMVIFDGSTVYEIPSGTSASVRGTKQDNTGFEYPCTIDDSVVSFDIQDQMTIFAGKVPCEIRLSKDGGIIGTCNFLLNVEETPLDPDVTISETDLPLLERAEQNAARAEAAADEAESILSSAVKSVNSVLPDSSGNVDIVALPTGGTAGQVLTKQSALDGDANWQNIPAKMDFVSSPTANDILLTDANGQAVDSGRTLSEFQELLTAGTGIDITNNVISNPNVYNAGDTLSLTGTHCVGVITGTRNLIRFFIPLNQPILASSISFSNLTISVRATVGTIVESTDVASTTGYSITVSRLQKNGIYIQVTLSTAASSVTNNTPLDVQIDSSSAVFN